MAYQRTMSSSRPMVMRCGFRSLGSSSPILREIPGGLPFGTEQLERIIWLSLLLSTTGVKYINVRGPVDTSFKEGEVISPREMMPSASIPREELRRIADKYGWWAARQAEALCPHSDVACVEREAKRLHDVVKHRKGDVSW